MFQPYLQALRIGRQSFPGIWRVMMPPEFQHLRVPEEKAANCAACPKICEDNWRADYRCCTYHPRVSNFLLGLALQTPAGESAIDDLLERGMLLPEGMHSSPQQWLDFLDDQHSDQFGRSERVLCPMLDQNTGYCRIHVFRNSVCSTYFCHKDQGSAGELFWSQIQTLGTQLEMRLSQWALQKAGFDVQASLRALEELAPTIDQASTDRGWRPEALQKIWGDYWGREKELLRACAEIIVQHADQLWHLAQSLSIDEAHGFDQALMNLIPREQQEELEEEEGEWEAVDLQALWADCLSAHDALWTRPDGLFTLSPNTHFVGDSIEYRYQDVHQTLAFRLPIQAAERKLLEGFRSSQRALKEFSDQEQDFLLDMIHRKVLWRVRPSAQG